MKIKLGTQVQVKPCRSCPFEGEEPIALSPESRIRYTENLVNLQGQHFCHSVNNEMICRGGRNLQLRALCAYRLIDKPTDEAFEKKAREVLNADLQRS